MPRFIGRQRLVRTADPVTRVPLATPVQVRNLTTGARVATVFEFAQRLTQAQRNALGDLGAYQLENDLACVYEVADHGDANGFRHLTYDVWETRASYDAGDPPAWRNSHLFQLSTRPGADHDAMIEWAIEDAIRDADLRSQRPLGDRARTLPDERDPRVSRLEAPAVRTRERTPA